ncbi:MAG: hemolysin family protein, partial [Bdellovibrionota bacterium]
NIFLKLLAILALVAANGFFVAAELALVGLRRSRMQELADEGSKPAERILKILSQLDDYISATQVGITIASLALGWFGEEALAVLFAPLFEAMSGAPASAPAVHGAAVGASFGLITVLHIVLGEQAPKIIALQSAEKVAFFCAAPLEAFTIVFRPAIWALNGMANAFVRVLGYRGTAMAGHHLAHSEEELKIIVETSKKQGVLEASEEELIHSVLGFTDRTVVEIMRPRPDMQMVPDDISLEKLFRAIADSERSRYPVYHGDPDKVVGTIHVKDVLEHLALKGEESFQVKDILRPPLFVPETRRLPDLLATLRRERSHMAIVLTEFGDVAGLVTMEDVLEALVGEIQDEFDEPEKRFEQTPEGHVLIQGQIPVTEVNERLGLELSTDDFSSIGGYVFGRLGRAPKVGDEVREDGFVLRVHAVSGLRVSRVCYQSLQPKAGPVAAQVGG